MGSNPPVLRDRHGWFVTPLDWAAANGHCEVVKELLRLDGTLLRKLTSKRRIRRLEILWDEETKVGGGRVADQGRALVAKDLLRDCQHQLVAAGHYSLASTPSGRSSARHGSGGAHFQDNPGAIDRNNAFLRGAFHSASASARHGSGGTHFQDDSDAIDRNNAFLRAGYGGWALYTAASAGDEDLAYSLLHIKPELSLGEGEYTLFDLLFAAARGRSQRIFNDILFYANIASPQQQQLEANEEKLNKKKMIPMPPSMLSKALLASAKAGNLEIVMCLLKGKDEKMVLSCRDSRGLTALHAAASQGHIEVTEAILKSSPMSILVQDFQGNTAMHAAACKGHILVVKLFIRFNVEVMTMRNSDGNTVLHVAVMGSTHCNNLSSRGDMGPYGEEEMALTCDLVQDLELGGEANIVRNMLVRELIKYRPVEGDFINMKNSDNRTALHMAVHGTFADDKIVEALIATPEIKLDVIDNYGMTPLDLAKTFYGGRSRACSKLLEAATKRIHVGTNMMGMDVLRKQVGVGNIAAPTLQGRSVRTRFPMLYQQSKDTSSSPRSNRMNVTTPPKRRLFSRSRSHSRSRSRSGPSTDFEEETTPFNTRSPTEAEEDDDEDEDNNEGDEEDTNEERLSRTSSSCTNFVWADIRQRVFALRSPDSVKDRRSTAGKTDSSELSTSSSTILKQRGSPFVRPLIHPSMTPDSLRHQHMMCNLDGTPRSLENNITPKPLLPSPPPPSTTNPTRTTINTSTSTTPTTSTYNISTSTRTGTSNTTRRRKNTMFSCLPLTSTKTNSTNNTSTSTSNTSIGSKTKPRKNLMSSCLPLPILMTREGHGFQTITSKVKKWLSPSQWCSSSRKKKKVHGEESGGRTEREEEEEEERGVEGNSNLMDGEEKKVVKRCHPIQVYNGEEDGLVALPLPPSHAYRFKTPTTSSKRLYTIHPSDSYGDRVDQYYSCRRTFVYSR